MLNNAKQLNLIEESTFAKTFLEILPFQMKKNYIFFRIQGSLPRNNKSIISFQVNFVHPILHCMRASFLIISRFIALFHAFHELFT